MDWIILHQFRRDHLAIKALLQNVEALHPALAHHQQLAIDRPAKVRRDGNKSGKLLVMSSPLRE